MAQTLVKSVSHSYKNNLSWRKGFSLLITISILCFCALMGLALIRSIGNTATLGDSMTPTILNQSTLLYSKSPELKTRLNRFDIIVFKKTSQTGEVEKMAKRIIGLPGDHVVIKAGQLFVNEEFIEENYLNEPIWGDATADQVDCVVPEGYLFVLGDNRNVSKDSRHEEIGLVSLDTDYLGLYLADWQ